MNKTGNHNLKKQEINIYREIQRNTEMAMKALDVVTGKIYDDRLAAVVAEQELQYSRLHDRAVQNLVEGKAQTYRENAMENMMLAAFSLGVGSCWINQLYRTREDREVQEKLAEIGVTPEEMPVAALALGWPAVDFPGPREKTGNLVSWVR